ncbi:MAG: adenosylcobinamide amidohydrolase [Rhodospirillaceae bacterium]|nr:adenosylcobinamide amidohydrolase [Rhodospirillaceae bacterium]
MASPTATAPFAGLAVALDPPWLIVRSGTACTMASWSLTRPGLVTADTVAWLEVRNSDLPQGRDPAALLAEAQAARGLAAAVGLMTSAAVADHAAVRRVCCEDGGPPVAAEVVATLGLNNAERVGRRVHAAAADPPPPGTINLLCHVSVPLTTAALLETLSVATQARTAAVMALGLAMAPDGAPATGTGTDCIVAAAPVAAPGGPPPAAYAGTHTAIGEAVGAAVMAAVDRAAAAWRRRIQPG